MVDRFRHYQNLGQHTKQIQSQLMMKHKDDLDSSNKILLSLLSELEYLSSPSIKNRMFEYYLENKTKSKQQTIELINFKLTLFRIAYNKYIKKYKEYEFPENFSLYDIINIVQHWKYGVPPKYKSVYDHFLAILNNRPFNDDENNYKEKNYFNPEEEMDPNNLINIYPNIKKNDYNPNIKKNDYNQIKGNFKSFRMNEERYNYKKIKKDNYQNIFDSSNSIKFESKCPCIYCRGEGRKTQWKCPKCSSNELINDQGKVICSNCGESKFIWKKKFKCGKYDDNYHDVSCRGLLATLSSLGSEANNPVGFLRNLTKQVILHEDEFLSE